MMPDGYDDDMEGRRTGTLQYSPREIGAANPRAVDYWRLPLEAVEEPQDSAINLRRYWGILLRHKFVIAGITAAALVVGIAITLLTTPIYQARATVQIDREAARVVSGQDVQPQEQLVSGEEFFQTQYGLIRSRSLAERVAEALGLARTDQFLKAMGVKTIAKDPAKRRDQVVNVLQSHLGVEPVRGSRLAVISFESPVPNISAQIANAFAENYIASNLDRRFESSSYARSFLEDRLQQVKAKLEDSERQLVAYASAQQIINLDDGDKSDPGRSQSLAAADLTALNASLAAAQANRIAAEQKWRQAEATQDYGTPEVLTSPTIQQLSQTRAKLAADYQEKLKIYKPDYPAMAQLKAQIDETDRQLRQETNNIRTSVAQNSRTTAEAAYKVALNEERSLAGRVEQLKHAVLDLRGRSIRYNILQREVDTNRSLYDGLLQRYKEVGVAGGIATNNLSIVDRAQPPTGPSKPRPVFNAAVSVVLGLGMGVLTAFFLEALDQGVRNPADVESKLGLPLLGTVPKLDKGVTPAEAFADVRSKLSEAYFSLTTALQFSTRNGVPRSLLVTSSRPGEGKSTTAYAIAQNFARAGMQTLLIDADMRNPSLHKTLTLDNSVGLSNCLVANRSLLDVAQRVETPNLAVVTSGPLPPSPAELLAAGRLRALLNEAENRFSLIVIDGPPVMGLADAPMIASLMQGTVLVLEAGVIGRNQARAAVRRIEMARGKLLGVVLTKLSARQAGYGYGYAYDYSYGPKLTQAKEA